MDEFDSAQAPLNPACSEAPAPPPGAPAFVSEPAESTATWPPPPTTPAQRHAYASPLPFNPLLRLVSLAGLLFLLQPIGLTMNIFASMRFFRFVLKMGSPPFSPTTMAAFISASRPWLLTSYVCFAVFAAGALVYLIWVYRATRNLPALGSFDGAISPGWAVGWHLVPIVALYRPYSVMAQLWKGSEAGQPIGEMGWQSRKPSNVVIAWWLATVVAYLLVVAGCVFPGMMPFTILKFVGAAAILVSAIISIYVMRLVSLRQEARYKEVLAYFKSSGQAERSPDIQQDSSPT